MFYQLTSQFQRLNETSGTVQNSSVFTVEISNKAEIDSGILIFPRQYYSYSGETLYARCIEGEVKIRVVPFIVGQGTGTGGGSGSSGSGSGADVPDESIASDTQADDMLDNIFG